MANEYGKNIDRIPSVDSGERFFLMVERSTNAHVTTLRVRETEHPKLNGFSIGKCLATINPHVMVKNTELVAEILTKLNMESVVTRQLSHCLGTGTIKNGSVDMVAAVCRDTEGLEKTTTIADSKQQKIERLLEKSNMLTALLGSLNKDKDGNYFLCKEDSKLVQKAYSLYTQGDNNVENISENG